MSDLEKTQSAGALVVPDFLKDVSGSEGMEAVRKDDLVLPRLAVCQSLSPQRNSSKPEFIEGLNEGDQFNTVTGEVIKKAQTIQIIPIMYSRSRIYYKPRTEGGGILCRSFNGIDGGTIAPNCDACPNSQFGADNKAPLCTKFMNFVVLTLPNKQMSIMSFKSKELSTARNFATLLLARKKPAYAQVYDVSTLMVPTPKGDFYGRKLTFAGFVQDEDLFKAAKACYDSLQNVNVQAHDEDVDQAPNEDIPF